VTPSQEKARDIPPRPWPPPQRRQEGNGDLLPTEDTIWKEQEKRDEEYRCRYFVTNLQGGTLIINGMEVKKGVLLVLYLSLLLLKVLEGRFLSGGEWEEETGWQNLQGILLTSNGMPYERGRWRVKRYLNTLDYLLDKYGI
jgi:hypothetical protein